MGADITKALHRDFEIFGLSPKSAGRISPLLFFYGWDSYVVFEAGKVIEKGNFPPPAQPLTARIEQ